MNKHKHTDSEEVEVISTGSWTPKQFQDVAGNSGISPLQVSKIHISKYGIDVYIRENVKIPNSFMVSSGERWGMKRKGSMPRGSKDVLEIAVTTPVKLNFSIYNDIKAIVKLNDGMKRNVIENRDFTVQWAEKSLVQNNVL